MIHRTEHIDALALLHGIEGFNDDNIAHLQRLSESSIEKIRENGGVLPGIAPLEHHPYITELNNDDITGLMIGTFPPISYLCDTFGLASFVNTQGRAITPPKMPYFHGNNNHLWEYAPVGLEQIIENDRASQPALVEAALTRQGVVYTDIIQYCQRDISEGYTASDKALCNISINNTVYQYLWENNNLNRLYFTNSSVFGGSNNLFDRYGNYMLTECDAFGLFLKGAQDKGFTIEYNLPDTADWVNINESNRPAAERKAINLKLRNKVYLNLKLTTLTIARQLKVCFAVSPAAVNRGRVRQNACVLRYRDLHNTPVATTPTALLTTVLQAFFDDTLHTLIPYNV